MRSALLCSSLAAACLSAQSEPAAPEVSAARVLVDFRGDGAGEKWRTVLDGVMGGRSTGSFEIVEGRLVFTGVLNTNGGGFSSVRRAGRDLQLGQPGEQGIRLRVRGDGRTYTLRLRQPTEGRRRTPSYRGTFATRRSGRWQDVYLPYADLVPTWHGRTLDLPPVTPRLVDELGISIDDGIDGPFRIEVDEIGTYGAFDFDDYRGARRPLVVFASDDGDVRLAQQLQAVEDARPGFDERDMVLVVVVADGRSFAGARPLGDEACAALRERFGRDGDGGFAVLLVGKDGGVKRTAAQPVAMADLFAQIDRMPMRIEEARRRRSH